MPGTCCWPWPTGPDRRHRTCPAGWTSLGTQTDSTGDTARIGYKIASVSGAQSTGTFTGAQALRVLVYRGAGVPTRMAWWSGSTPALSGLTPGAWLAMIVIVVAGDLSPAVAGLTSRSYYLYDTGHPVLGRAATSDPNAYWTALVEIPPRT